MTIGTDESFMSDVRSQFNGGINTNNDKLYNSQKYTPSSFAYKYLEPEELRKIKRSELLYHKQFKFIQEEYSYRDPPKAVTKVRTSL